MINKNMDIGSIKEEKEMVIERLEKVLNFLKGVQMTNAEDLVHIKKPLDDLESNLKYIPNGPLFNDVLPTEIKESILSYSCDSKAFVDASVCQEWKRVLENRFREKTAIIGNECSKCEFEDNKCVKATEILKAAAAHKLDVHLFINQPVIEVDPKIITDALTSVSKFTVSGQYGEAPILSIDQLEHLFTSIDKGDNIFEEVKLLQMDLNCLNQEILANCLVNKIKRLTLEQEAYDVRMLDIETFLSKLQQDSNNSKLTHLTLTFYEDFKNHPDLSSIIVNALCNVENLKLCGYTNVPMEQLLKNLSERLQTNQQKMKTLIIDLENCYVEDIEDIFSFYDFESLISPQDLKTLFNAMETLQLEGVFTLEQREAVASLPDIQVGQIQFPHFDQIFHSIKKGSIEIF